MPFTRPSITLIGFGAFGRLIAGLFKDRVPLTIHDRDPRRLAQARAAGFPVSDGPPRGDIILIAVPLQSLAACLSDIAPHLRPGQIVIDVCSVKEEPARLMQTLLPDRVDLLGAHPMFGPSSLSAGLNGCQLVLCPLRGTRWRRLARLLRRTGLDLVVTTPEDHDRQAALSQALVHILSRAVQPWGPPPRIRTRSYDLLAEALAMVRDDAPDVVDAIVSANRHVVPMRQDLLRALTDPMPERRPWTEPQPHATPPT